MIKTIAVIGAGSWGTALALHIACNGCDVRLWSHEADHVDAMAQDRSNERYLPGIAFPDNITLTKQLAEAISDVQDVLIVVPSYVFRSLLSDLKPHMSASHRLVWGSKGLDEQDSLMLHEVVHQELGKDIPVAMIAGPNFAKEVANKLPTATMIASKDETFSSELTQLLSAHYFRVYQSADLIGVQICSAVKNVMAIATGTSDGLGYGKNASSALITRGLIEMQRLGLALGALPETFLSLAGVGDLVLTCTGDLSRNKRFGYALGQGKTAREAKEAIGQVIEGAAAAKQVYQLAQKHQIDMPIVEQVYAVLYEGLSVIDAVNNLLSR